MSNKRSKAAWPSIVIGAGGILAANVIWWVITTFGQHIALGWH